MRNDPIKDINEALDASVRPKAGPDAQTEAFSKVNGRQRKTAPAPPTFAPASRKRDVKPAETPARNDTTHIVEAASTAPASMPAAKPTPVASGNDGAYRTLLVPVTPALTARIGLLLAAVGLAALIIAGELSSGDLTQAITAAVFLAGLALATVGLIGYPLAFVSLMLRRAYGIRVVGIGKVDDTESWWDDDYRRNSVPERSFREAARLVSRLGEGSVRVFYTVDETPTVRSFTARVGVMSVTPLDYATQRVLSRREIRDGR